jgi:signal transduction histidine kinase
MEVRVRQSERLAGIGQMIAVLTHESRNVLARSQAMIELLSEEVQGPPEAVELIDRLYKCQLELHRLYDEVRNYAAPIKLDRDIQGVGAIWRQTWSNLVANRDAAKEASLIEQTSGVDLTCEVDHFRLDQVFRNLFENSLSACPSPAQVEIACADAEIYGQPALRVIVRDNGPGLTPEQAQNVFHPFYTTKQNGTGLGMAIAKRIIDAHNGSIAVGGKSESGAEFIITLPRKGLGEG